MNAKHRSVLGTLRGRAAPLSLLVAAAFLFSLAPDRTARAQEHAQESDGEVSVSQSIVPDSLPPPVELQSTSTSSSTGSDSNFSPPANASISNDQAAAGLQNVAPPEIKSLVTGENKSGVTSKAISVPKGPGTIQGMGESFSAQPSTGIATFSVPFSMPKARGGAQPSVALGYSSSSGNGVAGIGWDVSVPFIARQTDRGLPKYQDQTTWHPEQDRFVYNGGQELVPIKTLLPGEELPTWATSGWQYFRPRIEGSYLRFFWNPADNVWRVQDKSGSLMEFGGDSNALEADPQNSAHVFRWNLRRQLDAHSNEVRYVYLKDGNTSYISDIYDTFPITGAQSGASLSEWAHHTRLVYESRPDVNTEFTRGWKVTKSLRLSHVDVTSVKDAGGGRVLLRRYHLDYAAKYHHSLLASLQVEGRCGDLDTAEGQDDTLPATNCPRLPAMTFDYSHVGNVTSEGFEPIDTTIHSMVGSPNHSVDEDYTDLYDVNSDGLPDVVTMMPGLYNGKHGLWLNGKAGTADKFGAQEPMCVKGVLGANETVIAKNNPNLVALDIDADATADLVHMPKVKTYSVYTPKLVSNEWCWVGRAVDTSDGNDARIDFGSDALDLRVFDVNGDGMVDVVKSSGTAYEVWFGLGRYPGGDGLFGSAKWTGAGTAQLSMEPVVRCVPHSSTPVRFSDADVKLADMNGDGLTDIVRVRKGDIRYWPGRGDGTFGTGPIGCAGGTFSDNSYVQMLESPQYTNTDGLGLHLDDVNGDGTSDLVQVRFDGVDVWLNVDGSGWGDRQILSGTPASPSYQNRVRIVDLNGSGTRDIVWGDGLAYKYIDLSAGKRPWLLTSVKNGIGKTTEIEYTTSTTEMLAAEAAGAGWTKKTPNVLHMVKRTTVRDGLGAVGRPEGVYVTEYTFRDPVYDGLQREFRGFSKTEIKNLGDTNSPTSATRNTFDLGERPTSFCLESGIDFTKHSERWRDNPQEGLKGLPVLVDTYDGTGTGLSQRYLSTVHHSYVLRKLYSGLDGRGVYVAFEGRSDSFLYDNTAGGMGWEPIPLLRVGIQNGTAQFACTRNDDVPMMGPSPAHLRGGVIYTGANSQEQVGVDIFGNQTIQVADGEVEADEPIWSFAVPELIPTVDQPNGDGRWSWRTVESWVGNSLGGTKRKHTLSGDYDTFGNPRRSQVEVDNAGSLYRHEPASVDAGVITPIGMNEAGKTWYDAWGNVIFETSPPNRCHMVDFDDRYGLLPDEDTTFAGAETTFHSDTLVEGGITAQCGSVYLTVSATYDQGLQAPVTITGMNGELTSIEYDGFGRMETMTAPNATSCSPLQHSLKAHYDLGSPISKLHVYKQDGANECSTGYHETLAYVDGMGRTVVTLSEADPIVDGHNWIAQGLTDYDAKGAERRKYLAWFYDGDPESYDLSVAAPTKYGQQRYDGFGRAIETIGLDGTITLRTKYHALSADAWDAEDIGPGPHQGTFASERKDGHGRVVETTERVRVGISVSARSVLRTYLPTGELTQIDRALDGAVLVSRAITYDSLGRMLTNTDANVGTWKYVYDIGGNLVGTSDARGCGSNYGYDAAGRLLWEDYAPCETHHPTYSPAHEVDYFYDGLDLDEEGACLTSTTAPIGKLVSVTDRSGKSITHYDKRGRTIDVAKTVASPTGLLENLQWFCKTSAYDGADRPKRETTGATENVGPSGSYVEPTYSLRGEVASVNSAYGSLVGSVKRDADGLVTEIAYGHGTEAPTTTTSFTYDDLRRLRNLTTYRPQFGGEGSTHQMLLQDEEYIYDRVGNPVEIRDWRIASEWENAPKPVNRKFTYDDLYRLTKVDYTYVTQTGSDAWVDPYAAEVSDNTRPQPSPRGDMAGVGRPLSQSWAYDWLGNQEATDDNAHAFYDRSLGSITHNGYRLTSADNTGMDGGRNGSLSTTYDAAGYMATLQVTRSGPCIGACGSQTFQYEWDEVGRLTLARRLDGENLGAELKYQYDASDARVLKTVGDRHTVYIFASLELRLATYSAGAYEVTAQTEVPYLSAHGMRLARVVHTTSPLGTAATRVFLELGDHLGTTSAVLDRESGELVERSTAYAYGAAESEYRPGRWGSFREDHRFTGKEDDVEVGLIYFGARYYAPLIGTWISADPLAVHAPGQADLNLYAYVHGRVLVAVDPVGLVCGEDQTCEPGSAEADLAPLQNPQGQNPNLFPPSQVPAKAGPKPAPNSALDERFSKYRDTGQLTSSPDDEDTDEPPPDAFYGAIGVTYGSVQGVTPLAQQTPSPLPDNKPFEYWRGAGMATSGAAEAYYGGSMALGGGMLEIASFGTGTVVAAPAIGIGLLLGLNGSGSLGQGISVMIKADKMSEGGGRGRVLNPAEEPVYRGGKDMTVKPGETRLNADGMVRPTHGVSLNTSPSGLDKFGGAQQIKTLPEGLKIIQRGSNLSHFEIVPTQPMTPEQFQQLLNKVEFH